MPDRDKRVRSTGGEAAPSVAECRWIGSARDDLSAMPDEVKRIFGFAIRAAQQGGKHPDAKPLKGFGGAGVLEVIENFDGDTFRLVYTLKFKGCVYVLDAFQKKSVSGIRTPTHIIERIKTRLKTAGAHYEASVGRVTDYEGSKRGRGARQR